MNEKEFQARLFPPPSEEDRQYWNRRDPSGPIQSIELRVEDVLAAAKPSLSRAQALITQTKYQPFAVCNDDVHGRRVTIADATRAALKIARASFPPGEKLCVRFRRGAGCSPHSITHISVMPESCARLEIEKDLTIRNERDELSWLDGDGRLRGHLQKRLHELDELQAFGKAVWKETEKAERAEKAARK